MVSVEEIKFIKSIVDLLNEQYPARLEFNKYRNCNVQREQYFTASCNDGAWRLDCSDYWISTSSEYIDLEQNLKIICAEEGIDVTFQFSYIITKIIVKATTLERKGVFIGRLDSIFQS